VGWRQGQREQLTHSKVESTGKPDFVVVDRAQGERVKDKRIVEELSAPLVHVRHKT
jgi:hypothetical protein